MASQILEQHEGNRRPHLQMLPAEIFEMIARLADDKALLALRLTSKECASKVLTTYTRVFFTEILFRIRDNASLMKCLRISRHRIFRHAVRTIMVSLDRCKRENGSWFRLGDCQAKHDPCFDRDGLMLLFEHLARYTKTTALRIVAQEEPKSTWSPPRSEDLVNTTCKQVSMNIMRTLRLSPLAFKTLDMATGESSGLAMLELDEHELECLGNAMLPLESLSLNVWRSVCLAQPEHEPLNGYLRTLGGSKSLRHLSISVQSHGRIDPLLLSLDDLPFVTLESLQLHGGHCTFLPVERLISFVSLHKRKLQRVHLSGIFMDDDEFSPMEEDVAKAGLSKLIKGSTGIGEVVVDPWVDAMFYEIVSDNHEAAAKRLQ